MVRDDALLAFERHATSKLRTPTICSPSPPSASAAKRCPPSHPSPVSKSKPAPPKKPAGTRIEIVGGRMHRVEDAGLPPGTTIAVRDLFFNTPARRKFLKSETTELLTRHRAGDTLRARPSGQTLRAALRHARAAQAPPVAQPADRIFQIFGKETLDHLLPIAAEVDLARVGLPEPPPWKRDEDYEPPVPGHLRLSGFTSKPELEKLNRNSIYSFVNRRLVRDRLLLHAVSEAYRNILPPTSFPVVLLFLELPPRRSRRERPSREDRSPLPPAQLRARLRARHPAQQTHAVAPRRWASSPRSKPTPPPRPHCCPASPQSPAHRSPRRSSGNAESFTLEPAATLAPARHAPRFHPQPSNGAVIAAKRLPRSPSSTAELPPTSAQPIANRRDSERHAATLHALASLKPLGQLRESFILATNEEGLWIIDQHVAHERVLFEKILREREVERVQRQRLLMPLLIDLTPAQMVAFAEIAAELERNGFEAEPFGPRTLAIKAAPVGLEGRELERMLVEVLEQTDRLDQRENLGTARARIAASIACHSAIKVNMPLDPERMAWLLRELGKTEQPTSCPHGRPIALRYSWKDIERAFHRI